MAALKTTHRKEMAAMEKRLSQSGEAVMWAELPKELLGMVLDKLQQRPLAGGVEGSKHVRLVSREWRDCHDALVTRLTVSWRTTDEGMWLLVRRFPSVVSLEVKYNGYYLTDEGMKAVSTLIGLTSLDLGYCDKVTDKGLLAVSSLTGLTSLNLCGCELVTDKGLLAVSSLTGLTSLDLCGCELVTDEGVKAVSTLTGLTSLNLCCCNLVTDEGMLAVSSLTGLTSLDISHCKLVTDEGLKAVSTLTGLTYLDLRYCDKVTDEGVEALRRDTASSNLRIHSRY
jgi:hypothetical protein